MCLELLDYLRACRAACDSQGLAMVYHFTDPAYAASIQAQGLRMSTQGHGDGVCFSLLGPASYGVGSPQYGERLSTAILGEGRIKKTRGPRSLDLIVVYAIDSCLLSRAPGIRDDAVMVPKSLFIALSTPTEDGDFFLRPDHIVGMVLVDAARPPRGLSLAKRAIAEAAARDKAAKDAFMAAQRTLDQQEEVDNEAKFERRGSADSLASFQEAHHDDDLELGSSAEQGYDSSADRLTEPLLDTFASYPTANPIKVATDEFM